MYENVYLHPTLRNRLTELEDELDLPIRVVTWNTERFAGLSWVGMTSRFTSEEAAEVGITIWCSGPRQDNYNYGFREHRFREFTTYECITYPETPESPLIYEDQVVGEIGDRWVGLSFTPNDGYSIPESFCDAVVEAVGACVDPAAIEGWQARAAERQRAAFENFVRRSYDSRFQRYRDAIDRQLRDIIDWQDNIVTAQLEVRRQNEMLDAMIVVRENDAGDQFMRQWTQLESHPRVGAIRFTGNNSIEITTNDDLRLYHPVSGESRWLGAFKITLALDNMRMRLQNLNTRRGGRDHPHIAEGAACFGGHQQAFTELLSNGEIYTLFELLLQYLETLNLADEYGRYGAYWFDAPDERPLEVTEAVAA